MRGLARAALLGLAAAGAALAQTDEREAFARRLDPRRTADKYARKDAVKDLRGKNAPWATELLLGAFLDPEAIVRDWAFETLEDVPDEGSLDLIIGALLHADDFVRENVCDLLGHRRSAGAVGPLLKVLGKYRETGARAAAARALGRIGDAAAWDGLEGRLGKDREPLVELELLEALSRIDGPRSVDRLLEGCASKDWQVAACALRSLALVDRGRGFEQALALAGHKAWPVRSHAIEVLGASRRKEAVEPLIARLGEEEGRLRHDAYMALVRLTGNEDLDATREAWEGWWRFNKDSFDPEKVAEGADRKGKETTRVSYYGVEVFSTRVGFIIDGSGSMKEPMGGSSENRDSRRIDVALAELLRTVDLLEEERRFNVYAYGTEPVQWQPRVQQASRASKVACAKWLERLRNPAGWSNLHDTVQRCAEDPDLDTIFLLSDGEPSVGRYKFPDRILEKTEEVNRYRRLRIYTIMTAVFEGDGAANRERNAVEFLTRLAEGTGGEFRRK
ncbi:MAG: HEAT repeat domain-containing protein [Planctomycetes bacterium]|nr:HEAT repeat domain-containing protein [Planctomycetota bacterium]